MSEKYNGRSLGPATPPPNQASTDLGLLFMVLIFGNSRTAAYANLTPVVALAVAWVWLEEVPRPLQLLGEGVVLAGLALARLGGERRS